MALKTNIDKTPSEIRKLVDRQLRKDRKTHSGTFYLPNPVFTRRPKYFIVWQEPAFRENDLKWIKDGYLNSLFNFTDFIVHYCAFRFLCGNNYDYYMTDLSKGALKPKDAQKKREKRYEDWRKVLEKEYEYFVEPVLIAMGTRVNKTLQDFGMSSELCFLHTSGQNNGRFVSEYSRHKSPARLSSELKKNVKAFANDTMGKKLEYTGEMRATIMGRLESTEVGPAHMGRYLYYKSKFSELSTLQSTRRAQRFVSVSEDWTQIKSGV